MMKKVLISLIAIIMILSAAGCGNNAEIEQLRKENEELRQQVATPEPTVVPTPAPAAPTTAPATTKPTHSAESVSNMLAETRSAIVKENYGYVNYDDLARNPNSYKGKSLTYEGKIAQLMEDSDTLADSHMVFVQMRLAVGGNYNNIVWVIRDFWKMIMCKYTEKPKVYIHTRQRWANL